MRGADALLAAPHRPARGPAPLRRGAGRRARAHGAARRGAARGGGDRRCAAARSWTPWRWARRATPSRTRSGDAHGEWRALQFLGELGARHRLGRRRPPLAGPGARARPPRGLRRLGRDRRLLDGRRLLDHRGPAPTEELIARSIVLLRELAGSSERIPSPVNIADHRTSQLGNRPSLSMVFEDTLQPFAEISCETAVSYALANQSGVARARGDFARARDLLEESAARFEAAGDEQGRAVVLARRGYLDLADGAHRRRRARRWRPRSSCAAGTGRSARRQGLVLSGLGFVETTAGDHESAERRLAEAREIFRRGGDRWGLAARAVAHGRPRLRPRPARRRRGRAGGGARPCSGPRSASAGSRTRSSGWPRWRYCAATPMRRRRTCCDARERYAARDDEIGVADVDDRFERLLSDALRAARGFTRDSDLRTKRRRR